MVLMIISYHTNQVNMNQMQCTGDSVLQKSLLAVSMLLTLHMRATGILLNVRSILAFIPGGGSNTKMRPARSRFTGT